MLPKDALRLKATISKKFGKGVQLLDRRKTASGVEVKLRVGDKVKWVPRRNVFDRTLASTLLLSPKEAKQIGYQSVRKSKFETRKKRIVQKLTRLSIDAEFLGEEKTAYLFAYKGVSFKIGKYSFEFEVKDRIDFLKRFYAWIRFERTFPLRYTDKEWRLKVEAASGGNVTSSQWVPADRGLPTLKCLRCDLTFSKPRLFNKKNTVIRCPNCDKKQSKNYSRQAILWIKDLEKRFGIKIQHAESKGGEANILLSNGTKTNVDGKHKDVVFEYHGSRWHGDITLFYLDDCPNPYQPTKTTLYFLKQTLQREKSIEKAGYKLIRIWGPDFVSPERYSQWLLANSKRLKTFLTQKSSR